LSRKKSYNCLCGDCDDCKEVEKEALDLSKTKKKLVDYSSDEDQDDQRCPSRCGGCNICLLEEDERLEVEEELKKEKNEKEEKIRQKERMKAEEKEEEEMRRQAEQSAARDCTCEDCVFCFDKYAIRKAQEMKRERDFERKKLNPNFAAEECNGKCIIKYSPAECISCYEEEEDRSEIMYQLTEKKKKRRENRRREELRMRLDPNYEKLSACPDGICGGCDDCLKTLPSGLLTTKISRQELEKKTFECSAKVKDVMH
jgi:hypothetical protein